MFRKLRREILWLCMILTSVITLTSFAVVYFTTASVARSTEANRLAEISASFIGHSVSPPDADGAIRESLELTPFSLSFVLDMDPDGNLINAQSGLAITPELYAEAARIASANPTGGTARIDGRLWRYSVDAVKRVDVDVSGWELDIAGDADGIRAAFLDVTDSRAATAQLGRVLIIAAAVVLALIFCVSLFFSAKAIRPVEEVWEKQKQFIANASHELKTPLTIVMSNLGALSANGGETVDSQRKWIDRIGSGCDRMSGLINELLRLARADTVAVDKTVEPVNLGELVAAAIAEEDARIAQRRLNVTSSLPTDVVVQSDGEKVSQLVSILLDNAVKYTDECGAIEIELTKSARFASIGVRNSGEGIAESELPMIFERFYRSGNAPKSEGSYGLGLSLARSIVTALGGYLTAESVPHKTTLFTLTLPVT
jgi:signal transduction histidine kinase